MRQTCVLLCAILFATRAAAAELQVAAAASLTDALQEIGRDFGREHRMPVRFAFAASSTLALQIREGAPIDVFVSADERQMDGVAREDLNGPQAPQISYSAAVVRGTRPPAAAAAFVNYLTSSAARRVFIRYGFAVR